MGNTTSIGWTDSTINLVWGCTKVSEGCENCYMFRLSKQFGRNPEVIEYLKAGQHKEEFDKKVFQSGKRIFVNSMSDTFHESIPFPIITSWLEWMKDHPEKQFQVLTKRIGRARKIINGIGGVADNIWIGTSVENNSHLFRIDTLSKIKAKIKFISFEPLLEEIDVMNLWLENIQWVIVGGESDSKNPRIMNPYWAWQIYNTCKEFDIPFFFKQIGGVGGDGAGGCILLQQEIKEFPR